jgi:hypothetical protein
MNALKRLLANGPLTGFPTRRADQDLLLRLAAARFDPQRTYTEAEVNEILRIWLATFCAPFGIDHVSLRRTLVDARLLARDSAGSSYRLAARYLQPCRATPLKCSPRSSASAPPASASTRLKRRPAPRAPPPSRRGSDNSRRRDDGG